MMKCTRRGCKSVTLHRVNRYHAPRRQEDEEYQQIENDGGNVDFFTALRMDGLFGFHVKKFPFRFQVVSGFFGQYSPEPAYPPLLTA